MRVSRVILFFSLTMMSYLPVYAGIEVCPSDAVHCAYITGLSTDLNNGRYIKLHNNIVGNLTMCFNGNASIFLDEYGAAKYKGTNTDEYFICADEKGEHCQQVGIDKFVVFKNNGYMADPRYYNINLSHLKDQYPACNA